MGTQAGFEGWGESWKVGRKKGAGLAEKSTEHLQSGEIQGKMVKEQYWV